MRLLGERLSTACWCPRGAWMQADRMAVANRPALLGSWASHKGSHGQGLICGLSAQEGKDYLKPSKEAGSLGVFPWMKHWVLTPSLFLSAVRGVFPSLPHAAVMLRCFLQAQSHRAAGSRTGTRQPFLFICWLSQVLTTILFTKMGYWLHTFYNNYTVVWLLW